MSVGGGGWVFVWMELVALQLFLTNKKGNSPFDFEPNENF